MPNKKSKHRRSQSKLTLAEPCERRLLLSTYTVNTLSDAVYAFTGQLTLRQAVADANAHGGSNTIAFDPALFAPASMHTIMLTQGEIEFTDTTGATTVDGPGAGVLAVSGNSLSRVFEIEAGVTVEMSGVTITGGKQTIADSSGNTYGGAILNAGTLTVVDSTVFGNEVVGTGYALSNKYNFTNDPGIAFGGGIYSIGTLTVSGSTLSGNTVANQVLNANGGALTNEGGALGGAMYCSGTLTLSDDTISGNSAVVDHNGDPRFGGNALGAGVYAADDLIVEASTVSGNTAMAGNCYFAGYGGDADGAGIYGGGTVTIGNSIITSNIANGGQAGYSQGTSGVGCGGGVYAVGAATVTDTQISSNQATGGATNLSRATSAGGGIFAETSATLVADEINENSVVGGPCLDFAQSFITGSGGGVYGGNLELTDTSVMGNSVTAIIFNNVDSGRYGGVTIGGGIVATAASTITGCTVADNKTTGGEGYNSCDDYNTTSGGNSEGGGVYNSAALTITNSTIADNTATGGQGGSAMGQVFSGAAGGNGLGGGIFSTGSLIIADSTLSGNAADGGAGGTAAGGLPYYLPGAPGTATGGGIDIVGGDAVLTNAVVSNDKAATNFSDIVGTLTSTSDNNLIGIGGGLTNGTYGNKIGINNPDLSPLGNYGGPTETMLPLPGSPVIDAGNNSLIPAGVTTDQRGYSRIVGNSVDIGSVEYTAAVSGTVYNDLNGNGIDDAGDPGVAGVVVYVDLTESGYLKPGDPSTTTDSSGNYVFDDLPAGNYIIHQVVPSGYRESDPAGGKGEHVSVSDVPITGADFGITTSVYISGQVTINGIPDGGAVIYTRDAGQLGTDGGVGAVITDANGQFTFVEPFGPSGPLPSIFSAIPTGEGVYTQTLPTTDGQITVTPVSGGVYQKEDFAYVSQKPAYLTGAVIGTSGSYQNKGNTAANAFDGNLNTFFDAPAANNDYVGLALVSPTVVQQIDYAPRPGFASRMIGGEFQGSNSANFASAVTLYTITSAPAVGVLTAVTLTNTTAYQYLRYLAPAGSYGNVAEVEFYSAPQPVINLSNGTLSITGTSGNDNISVNYGAIYYLFGEQYPPYNQTDVEVNGITTAFIGTPVQNIDINSLGGNDTTSVSGYDYGFITNINMVGGSGNDTVSVNPVLSTDQVDANQSTNILLGNGNDNVTVTGNDNTIVAGNGNDTVTTIPQFGDSSLNASITLGNGNDSEIFEEPINEGSSINLNVGSGLNAIENDDPGNDVTVAVNGGPAFTAWAQEYEFVGSVFVDSSGTGQYSAGDPVLSGVEVYADLNNTEVYEAGDPVATTDAQGNYIFVDNQEGSTSFPNEGSFIFRVVPPPGYHIETQDSGLLVNLGYNQYELAGFAYTGNDFAMQPTAQRLTGTVIGTSGSFENQGNTATKAFDGSLSTYFDGPTASGGYAGLDLGSAKVVTSISYAPRSGWAGRMVGGEIQASNSANFSSGVVTLFSISSAPATGTLTPQLLTNTTSYRYYRYIGPANSYCNIAELSFW